MEHAPTIDLSPAFGGSISDREEVAMQIDSACRSTGFFVAIGHGVEKTLLENWQYPQSHLLESDYQLLIYNQDFQLYD